MYSRADLIWPVGPFKGAQAWDIRSLRFSWFLHHKVSTCIKIFRGAIRGAKFLTRMLSLFLRRFFSKLGPKFFFSVELLRSLVSVNNDFLKFFRYLKNYLKIWLPDAYAPAFMRMLSIHIRNLCACWACASGTDACTEHTSQELVRALSICIRY